MGTYSMTISDDTARKDLSTPHRQVTWHKYAVGPLLTIICMIYVAHVYSYNFVSDDAFITLRYSRHLAEGHGLVFNLNNRVEGFTSPLWTFVLAGTHVIGCDLLLVARLLGVAIGLVTIVLSYRLVLVSSDRRIPPLIAAIAPLALAANGSFGCWAASGMETMLYVCLVVASFLAVFSGNLLTSALLTIALILARPEGFVVCLALSLFQVLRYRENGLTRTAAWLLACYSTAAALCASRYLYYGHWLPNTYYAKTGGGLHAVSRGIAYLAQYAEDHEGLILMGVPVVYAVLCGNVRQRFLTLGVICLWVTTVMVGGDALPMYRFALAPLPLLIILQVHLIGELYGISRPSGTSRWRLHVASIAVAGLLMAVHATRPIVGGHYGLYEHQKKVEIPRWTRAGRWLKDNAQEGDSLAAVPIGAVSYYSELTVYDMLGLTDEHIAHRKMAHMGQGWAGHEKHDGQYILSRRPTYLLLGNIDVTDRPRDPRKMPFIPCVRPAIWRGEKELYETGLIATMYKPRSAEIAPGQFLNFYELREQYRSEPDDD